MNGKEFKMKRKGSDASRLRLLPMLLVLTIFSVAPGPTEAQLLSRRQRQLLAGFFRAAGLEL